MVTVTARVSEMASTAVPLNVVSILMVTQPTGSTVTTGAVLSMLISPTVTLAELPARSVTVKVCD